jgi:thioredoxin-related protein
MIILGLVSNEVLVLLCMRLPNQNYLVLLPNERNYLVSATKCTLIPNEKYLIIVFKLKILGHCCQMKRKILGLFAK